MPMANGWWTRPTRGGPGRQLDARIMCGADFARSPRLAAAFPEARLFRPATTRMEEPQRNHVAVKESWQETGFRMTRGITVVGPWINCRAILGSSDTGTTPTPRPAPFRRYRSFRQSSPQTLAATIRVRWAPRTTFFASRPTTPGAARSASSQCDRADSPASSPAPAAPEIKRQSRREQSRRLCALEMAEGAVDSANSEARELHRMVNEHGGAAVYVI
jgi:hypothetical protein